MSAEDGGVVGEDSARRRGGADASKAPRPVSLVWKTISIVLGSLLLLVGLVGLVVPGIQGILTILAGLALLSPHSRRARQIMQWIKGLLTRGRRRRTGDPGGTEGA